MFSSKEEASVAAQKAVAADQRIVAANPPKVDRQGLRERCTEEYPNDRTARVLCEATEPDVVDDPRLIAASSDESTETKIESEDKTTADQIVLDAPNCFDPDTVAQAHEYLNR